jgi:hypothetical protein
MRDLAVMVLFPDATIRTVLRQVCAVVHTIFPVLIRYKRPGKLLRKRESDFLE